MALSAGDVLIIICASLALILWPVTIWFALKIWKRRQRLTTTQPQSPDAQAHLKQTAPQLFPLLPDDVALPPQSLPPLTKAAAADHHTKVEQFRGDSRGSEELIKPKVRNKKQKPVEEDRESEWEEYKEEYYLDVEEDDEYEYDDASGGVSHEQSYISNDSGHPLRQSKADTVSTLDMDMDEDPERPAEVRITMEDIDAIKKDLAARKAQNAKADAPELSEYEQQRQAKLKQQWLRHQKAAHDDFVHTQTQFFETRTKNYGDNPPPLVQPAYADVAYVQLEQANEAMKQQIAERRRHLQLKENKVIEEEFMDKLIHIKEDILHKTSPSKGSKRSPKKDGSPRKLPAGAAAHEGDTSQSLLVTDPAQDGHDRPTGGSEVVWPLAK